MEYLGHLVSALFQPINCVANYGTDLLHVTGNFVQCIGGNLLGATNSVVGASADVVTNVATVVTSIGG